MKLKKNHKLVIAADGSAASGKTTGAKTISKKYGLKFLSSGLLYRYASYQLLKHKPKNTISFLKKCFNRLNLNKLNNKNLHSPEVSAYSSTIAKEKKIRKVLKNFQKKFVKKYNKVCIEGRDIGTVILPNADIKIFFKCKSTKHEMRIFGRTNIKRENIIKVPNLGDHRICMSAVILSLVTGIKAEIKNFETVKTSSPSFLEIIKSLGGKYEVKKTS